MDFGDNKELNFHSDYKWVCCWLLVGRVSRLGRVCLLGSTRCDLVLKLICQEFLLSRCWWVAQSGERVVDAAEVL